MNNLQKLHAHSIFCDGKHSVREMVEFAVAKGFDSIGFSGHSYMPWSVYMSSRGDKTEEYKNEVKKLKAEYRGEIDIFLGLECEFYSEVDFEEYDYLIGSVHYFRFGDEYVAFDRNLDVVKGVIDERFGGDGLLFAKAYYELVSRLPERGRYDIIGHFDLITKNNEIERIIDVDSPVYKTAAIEALESLAGKIPFFEVNTGAIARGYRTSPYPSVELLKEMKRLGFGALISSDCHDGEMLDCNFEEARRLLIECGFKERFILTEKGFKEVEI